VIVLVVIAMAVGGPHGHPPVQLADGHLEVARGGRVLATSEVGNLELRLPRATYRVDASLEGSACEERSVRLRRKTELRLYCSVP
jgi:hypothetical protein